MSALPRTNLSFRGTLIAAFGATSLCFLGLLGLALWSQLATQRLTDRADMARRQAQLVSRLEADIADLLITQPMPSDGGANRIAPLARQYLATIEEERGLIGSDAAAHSHQDAEAVEARRFAGMVTTLTDRRDFAQARRLSRTIAAREEREAQFAAREARRVQTNMWRMIGAAAAFILAAYIYVMFSLWRAIVRPIGGLIGAMGQVEAEIPLSPVKPSGPDELRTLIARFNNMALAVEGQVARRTAELQAMNRELTDIDQRRRLFFSKVSHELRTPVAVLRGEAEVALRGNADAPALRQALLDMMESSLFLQRRLDDLLALARAEDGALHLLQARFDLCVTLAEVIRHARPFALANGIALATDLSSSAIPMMGDGARIEQAIMAVIDNAVKFSPPSGCVTLALRLADGIAHLSVSDQGPGVADADLSAIFDPYVQTRTGRDRGGTGIGLAVARWIVLAHGGSIAAQNVGSGEGLCVILSLPIAA